MNWYLEVLKKYATFSGRARRKEYWFFKLFDVLVFFLLSMVDVVIGTNDYGLGFGLLSIIYGLGTLIPSLAVGVRRLHDIGKSGWWLLICLIPIIGVIVVIVFSCLDSQVGENKYGPNPKEIK